MSTGEQARTATLSEFTTDTTEDTQNADTPAWQPQDDRECRSCGAKVSDAYRRALGDNQNRIHECPECPDSSHGRRKAGAAAGLDVQERKLTTGGNYQ